MTGALSYDLDTSLLNSIVPDKSAKTYETLSRSKSYFFEKRHQYLVMTNIRSSNCNGIGAISAGRKDRRILVNAIPLRYK